MDHIPGIIDHTQNARQKLQASRPRGEQQASHTFYKDEMDEMQVGKQDLTSQEGVDQGW